MDVLKDPATYVPWMVFVVFSICVHELAHAWVALRNGDPTAAEAGHITLNPLRQMGLMSLVMLVLLGIAWGAVPVTPARLTRGGRAAVAAAGPLANLALAAILALLAAVGARLGLGGQASIVTLLVLGAAANGVLFLFNALPVPGLDGWNLLATLVPALDQAARFQGLALLLFVILMATQAFDAIFAIGTAVAMSIFAAWSWLLNLV